MATGLLFPRPMKAAVAAVAVLAVLAACNQAPADDTSDDWPPPAGTQFESCFGIEPGDACTDAGWCMDCELLVGCFCDGDHYECYQAATLCDFGEGASCAHEGNPGCGIPPSPEYCSCAAGVVECDYVCPLAECPDFDPATTSCTCADGSCP